MSISTLDGDFIGNANDGTQRPVAIEVPDGDPHTYSGTWTWDLLGFLGSPRPISLYGPSPDRANIGDFNYGDIPESFAGISSMYIGGSIGGSSFPGEFVDHSLVNMIPLAGSPSISITATSGWFNLSADASDIVADPDHPGFGRIFLPIPDPMAILEDLITEDPESEDWPVITLTYSSGAEPISLPDSPLYIVRSQLSNSIFPITGTWNFTG